jgi:hypothetical protein
MYVLIHELPPLQSLWLVVELALLSTMPPSEWQMKIIGRCIASSSYRKRGFCQSLFYRDKSRNPPRDQRPAPQSVFAHAARYGPKMFSLGTQQR